MTKTQSGPLFIGVDIGTTSVKALLSGPGGTPVDSYTGDHAVRRPVQGAAEQSPADWMRHVEAALTQFAAHPRAGAVAAIGITSQVNTHVFCDETLSPLRPAITWQDTRPAAQAAMLDSSFDEEAKIAAFGAPIPIDASHALSRMAFVAQSEPEVWANTRYVLLPKDFAIARLTGSVVTDPLSGVGLVGTDLTYAEAVLALEPRAPSLLPTLADPCDVAGTIASEWPFAGLPIAVGTMDAWASMFGLGVVSNGQAMYLSGTSEVMGLISSQRVGAPGIITFPNWNGITLHAGPTQSGGASLAWLSRLIGVEVRDLGALAEKAPVHAQSPLFLPHLEGERAPLWDPHSRGAFIGLDSNTGPAEIATSVMEGVAFAARLALESIEVSGGQRVETLRHGGGGAVSDTWCQIRANALGRSLDRVVAKETGAMGALVIAGAASGTLDDLEGAIQALVSTEQSFHPDLGQSAMADERFNLFKELYHELAPIHHRLTRSRS